MAPRQTRRCYRRYLENALGQSRKVGRLAQELFELARLEYGVVKPDKERFALAAGSSRQVRPTPRSGSCNTLKPIR